MIITTKISILFTLPEDQEKLDAFRKEADISEWKVASLSDKAIAYSRIEATADAEVELHA